MAISKTTLLEEIAAQVKANHRTVAQEFVPLPEPALNWRKSSGAWNILECIDHLNREHAYYRPRLAAARQNPQPATRSRDDYAPSLLGRIYMYFAFNPRFSFPTAAEVTPAATPNRAVLAVYLHEQLELQALLKDLQEVDLRRTRVLLRSFAYFNFGDCLQVLAYHDRLHLEQARRVLAGWRMAGNQSASGA